MKRRTKDWSATESTDFAGSHRKLVVTGEVETFAANERATLSQRTPEGINPTILLLDLAVATQDMGAQVLGWTRVSFTKAIGHHQYRSVAISGDGIQQEVAVVEEIS